MSRIDDREGLLPFWGHVEEMRGTLIRILAVVTVGICLAFCFHQEIIGFLTGPMKRPQTIQIGQATMVEQPLISLKIYNAGPGPATYSLPKGAYLDYLTPGARQLSATTFLIPQGEALFIHKESPPSLLILSPIEGMVIALKISIWVGILGTAPLWGYMALNFILPALGGREKLHLMRFFSISFIFICLGITLAFYLTIPIANLYLQSFNREIGTDLWTLALYLNYSLFLMLANAVAFQLFAIGIFLVHLRLVSAEWLVSQRRLMIVMAFIVGALLTPPDILTQSLLAGLLIIFYEVLIIYAKSLQRVHQKNKLIIFAERE